MDTPCPSCHGLVGAGMSFCPTCGAPTVDQAGANYVQDNAPQPQYATFTPPPMATAPMAYPMPYPHYYSRPPMSGLRMASVAGGVILLVDSILAGIVGIALLFDWLFLVGILLIVGLAMGITGAVSVFIIRLPLLGIIGACVLMAGGAAVIFAIPWSGWIIGIIGIILAIISLTLIMVGWREMQEKALLRDGYGMYAPQMGMPYQGMPPPNYPPGPGGPMY
jgi:hypothetical protein